MRIFLDANILFSAAKTDGAMRRLLAELNADGHSLVADIYVCAEAQRNIAAKATTGAIDYLQALLSRIEIRTVQSTAAPDATIDWLPAKDRPVLLAAIATTCDVLITGDRTHFGAGYGKSFDGVIVYAPAQLAQALWGGKR